MLFAFIGYDKPNGVDARLAARPDHLKHLESLGEKLVLAGPFLNDKGEMNGSFMVLEAENQAEAEATYGQDPFVQRGIFASYEVRPYRIGINNTKP